jgi:hypothetical protein
VTRPDAPIFVYIISVMNLSQRQATMISSEIGESVRYLLRSKSERGSDVDGCCSSAVSAIGLKGD